MYEYTYSTVSFMRSLILWPRDSTISNHIVLLQIEKLCLLKYKWWCVSGILVVLYCNDVYPDYNNKEE